jgi:fructose-bisphosphate aldolase class II
MGSNRSNGQFLQNAWRARTVVPAFNIPYLPMMEAVVRALRDTDSFGLIAVARLEWVKFESRSLEAVHAEYERLADPRFTGLHLDHVPVIDEDNAKVDYEEVIGRAIEVGYGSVMVDGSRLSLRENIVCSRKIAEMAHAVGIPVEAELGAVLGHEAGPLPSYDELFASGRGFTDPDEAALFVRKTGVDWLSVAIGNIHGAISGAARHAKKTRARLDLEHLARISGAAGIPLVLHGGTGIPKDSVIAAVRKGVAKVNVATGIRQPYERLTRMSASLARQAVYDAAVDILGELEVAGQASIINPESRSHERSRY